MLLQLHYLIKGGNGMLNNKEKGLQVFAEF